MKSITLLFAALLFVVVMIVVIAQKSKKPELVENSSVLPSQPVASYPGANDERR